MRYLLFLDMQRDAPGSEAGECGRCGGEMVHESRRVEGRGFRHFVVCTGCGDWEVN